MLELIAIGKKHESWISDGVERYQKRLQAPFNVEWRLLPPSHEQGMLARQKESKRILEHLKSSDYVVLLDERGQQFSSPALSRQLQQQFAIAHRIVLVIGGAYGVDKTVLTRANLVWSLSQLVFPHQLVRLILIEQLYRAQEIAHGGAYHHA